LFVGPADLSASLDVFGAYDSEPFREAVTEVLDHSDVPVGTLAVAPEQVDRWRELGFDYQVVAADVSALQRGVTESLSRYDEHGET
jgi:2-keto-3-deoxy-L-rhamnonate aldolase RhmA